MVKGLTLFVDGPDINVRDSAGQVSTLASFEDDGSLFLYRQYPPFSDILRVNKITGEIVVE